MAQSVVSSWPCTPTLLNTADITPVGKARAFGIILADAVISLALTLAVGYILQDYGLFYVCLGPTTFVRCAALITLFCLPDPIPTCKYNGTTINCVKPFIYLKNVFWFYIFEDNIKQHLQFIMFILITTVMSYAGI